ncbi:MAG TPA: DUF1611 domain-containing protein [Thermoanaerobaculia bacterium]|nr:DUF1611 domain-containing protein [Thermoanaerobaculia bacterium]
MKPTAVVLCNGYFRTVNGKTAHGLVRGSDRYRVVGVIDPPTAGLDAGEVLEGKRRGIPIYASLDDALTALPEKPDYAIVGIATHGGRMTREVRAALREALEKGISVVNGLHEFASDVAALAGIAGRSGLTITDVRRVPPKTELHFWTGEILKLTTPRIAVLGTDCALGKRTTTRMLSEACRRAGVAAEWIGTGQTGWLQGAPFGIVFDALPNDFVTGELEHAILSCARELSPEVIFLEGQSSLRNPSGPCGSELILSAASRGVILQHAPGRVFFEGHEEEGCRIPPVEEEIGLIRLLGARTLALTLNGDSLTVEELRAAASDLERRLGIPAVLPLEDGVDLLVPVIREFLLEERS